MAQHNQVRGVGFLLKDPTILNEGIEGSEKILFQIRTIRRHIDDYRGKKFEDLIVFYDGSDFMEKMKKLKKFDLVDIKGVVDILTVDKQSICPYCGKQNVKHMGSSTFIYPIAFFKLNNVETSYEHNEDLPEAILQKHYREVSNEALIVGTVVSTPEMIGTDNIKCCRYRLGVDRKYYIKTQGDVTADYPWVYTYGKQAEWDSTHLKEGALVLVNAFIHNREIDANTVCMHCGADYTYPDVVTELIPYSVEYLNNYKTNEEIALEYEKEKREKIHKELLG